MPKCFTGLATWFRGRQVSSATLGQQPEVGLGYRLGAHVYSQARVHVIEFPVARSVLVCHR